MQNKLNMAGIEYIIDETDLNIYVLTLLFAILIYWCYGKLFSKTCLENIRGPKGLPIIGNLSQLCDENNILDQTLTKQIQIIILHNN